MMELDIQYYLELTKYDFIYNRIRYHIVAKSCITYVISHSYAKTKVDSYDSLPLGKPLTFHYFIILIKPVFNRDENNYYKIILEKGSDEQPKNNDNK